MTKKSLARQQRDEVAKNVKQQGVKSLYTVLEEMYQQQVGLFQQYANMIQLISHDEVKPHLVNAVRVDALLSGMAVDIDDLLPKTQTLYAAHRGTSGMPDPLDEDIHYNLMQMQQQYIVYMGVHQQNIMPVMFELDEHLNAALRLKQSIQANTVAAATATNAVIQQAQVAAPETPAVAAVNPYEAPAV